MSIPPIGLGPLGASEWNVGSVSGLNSVISPNLEAQAAGGVDTGSGQGGAGSFSGALTKAISALDTSQNTAATASDQLATGQATDPTQAVTAVENASLDMDFASQVRNQIDQAAQTIFQTQM